MVRPDETKPRQQLTGTIQQSQLHRTHPRPPDLGRLKEGEDTAFCGCNEKAKYKRNHVK